MFWFSATVLLFFCLQGGCVYCIATMCFLVNPYALSPGVGCSLVLLLDNNTLARVQMLQGVL